MEVRISFLVLLDLLFLSSLDQRMYHCVYDDINYKYIYTMHCIHINSFILHMKPMLVSSVFQTSVLPSSIISLMIIIIIIVIEF